MVAVLNEIPFNVNVDNQISLPQTYAITSSSPLDVEVVNQNNIEVSVENTPDVNITNQSLDVHLTDLNSSGKLIVKVSQDSSTDKIPVELSTTSTYKVNVQNSPLLTTVQNFPTAWTANILNWPSLYTIQYEDDFKDYNKKTYHCYLSGNASASFQSKTINLETDFPEYFSNPDKYEFYFEVKYYNQLKGDLNKILIVCKTMINGNVASTSYNAPFEETSLLLGAFGNTPATSQKYANTGTIAVLSQTNTYSEKIKAKMFFNVQGTQKFTTLEFQPYYPSISSTTSEAYTYYFDINVYWKEISN